MRNSEQEIKELKIASDEHRQALKTELSVLIEQSKKLALRIMLIGGGLALAYIIAKNIFGSENSENKKNKKVNTMFAEFRNFILAELASFVLTLAKEKLTEYLKEAKTETYGHTEDTD